MPRNASPGRPPLPLARILATALEILDAQGAEGLTMRRLAEALGSGTATLYRHFASREDLISQVVDQVFAEMHDDARSAGELRWQDVCRGLAHQMFAVLGRHPGAARLLVDAPPVGPNAMIQRERSLAVLLASGFAPRIAARTYATLARYVLGFAMQLTHDLDAAPPDAFRGLDQAAFPATFALAAALPVSLEEEFSFGLDLMLEGLAVLQTLPGEPQPGEGQEIVDPF